MVRESAPQRLPVTGTPCETVTMSRFRFINRHRPAADNEGFFRDMASLTSTGRMGAGTPHSPRQAIYAAMLFQAHPTAIRTSRLQRFAFASLSGLGRMLGMSR